jgi:hypothetical protein
MPAIDLSILNQKQTPAFYADTLANRPAAGFVGRIFVSTDTFAFYRDNGTTWDLIGGPGTGTVTGTGANGQVTYWNGVSTITGSNDLFFDAVNGHLGIGTVTPGTALDVKHDQSTVVQLEQITATNDIRIAFINNGVGLWRLGAFYNAGANDFGLFDIAGATQPVTVKRTTGQVLIGTSTVGSGKLVVASSTGDNGVQIVGASAPSLRIDNAESGPTKRAGFGISTATNNFIQGSADRDFCMFNGSTTASPILFGIYGTTNVVEAARISAARNFLIGTTTDGGQRLQISGSARATSYYLDGMTAASGALYWTSDRVTLANYNVGGTVLIEVNGGQAALSLNSNLSATFSSSISAINGLFNTASSIPSPQSITAWDNTVTIFGGNTTTSKALAIGYNTTNEAAYILSGEPTVAWRGMFFGASEYKFTVAQNATPVITLSSSQNVLIGTTTDAGQKLQVQGNIRSFISNLGGLGGNLSLLNDFGNNGGFTLLNFQNAGAICYIKGILNGPNSNSGADLVFGTPSNDTNGVDRFKIKASGVLNIVSIPTSAAGLVSGDIYSNLGVLTIVP